MPPFVRPCLWPRSSPLIPARLIQRRNRFLADVELQQTLGDISQGTQLTAHCPNTGAMEGLTQPGTPLLIDYTPSPTRKLAFTLELAWVGNRWIGINTSTPNRIVKRLLEENALLGFGKLLRFAPERKIGPGRRTDFVLETQSAKNRIWHFLEVKNCHLIYPDGYAYFPDCVSERASHHLNALIDLHQIPVEKLAADLDPFKDGKALAPPQEIQTHVLFIVQIPGASSVRPSDTHDPAFAMAARQCHAKGLNFHALAVEQHATEVHILKPLTVDLKPYDFQACKTWKMEAKARKSEPLSSTEVPSPTSVMKS